MKKLKDINWNHLYCFYEVAKAKSLKGGIRSIGVAASTASEQIKKLEESLSMQLFVRSKRRLILSRDGELLYEHAKEVFEAGSKLLDDISPSEVGGYPVTVGIEDTVFYSVACELCSQYWDLYTEFGMVNTSRQYDHDHMIDNITMGNVDWGLSLRAPKRKGLASEKMGSFELFFCCSQELYDQFIDKKDILRNIPLAQVSWDETLSESVMGFLKSHEIQPKEFILSDHLEYTHKLCVRGRCVMLLTDNPFADLEGIKTFSIDRPMIVSLYAIWARKNEGLLSIKKLKELIQSKFEKVPSQYEDHSYQVDISDIDEGLLK